MEGTCDYSTEQWQDMKDTIYELYIVQNHKFRSMMAKLATDFDFRPTKNKFLNMLKMWKFQKYCKGDRWRALPEELKRKGVDLDLCDDVEVDGRVISIKKLRKELQRHGAKTASQGDISPTESTGTKQSFQTAKDGLHRTDDVQEIGSASVRSPEVSHLLRLPMFELLRILQPDPSIDPSNDDQSQDLILLYQHVRIYILDTIAKNGQTCSSIEPESACDRLILTASACLLNQFEITKLCKEIFQSDSRKLRIESVIPDVCIVGQTYLTSEPCKTGSLKLEHIATLFFILHLCLNCLISRSVLDKFVDWCCTNENIRQSLLKALSSTSFFSRHIRTELLHSAIRIRNHQWAAQFLDVRKSQLSYFEIRRPGSKADSIKVSPLQAAILMEDPKMVQIFLDAGLEADSNIPHSARASEKDLFLWVSPLELALQYQRTFHLRWRLMQNYVNTKGIGIVPRAVFAGAPWDLISQCIADGADIHESFTPEPSRSSCEMSAIHAASMKGNIDVLRSLLQLGLNVDGLLRKKEAVHSVSDCKGDCCFRRPIGPTPLILAIQNRHSDAARILLEFGADANYRCPLSVAITTRAFDLVATLLDCGAAPAGSDLRRVCIHAIEERHTETLNLISTRGMIGNLTSYEWTSLFTCAARVGIIELVKCLLSILESSFEQHNAHLESVIYDLLWKTIATAAGSGHLDLVKYLTEYLKGSCHSTDDEWNLLEAAASSGDLALFDYAVRSYPGCLQEHAATETLENTQLVKNCLLTVAVASKHSASAIALLRDGASPGGDFLTNGWVARPIYNAIARANLDLIRALVKHGLGMERLSNAFWKVTEISDQLPTIRISQYFMSIGLLTPEYLAENHFRLHELGFQGDALVDMYIASGVSTKDADARTTSLLLAFAIRNRRFDFAMRLVEEGAPLDHLSNDGKPVPHSLNLTALQAACQHGHVTLVEMLLERGADPNRCYSTASLSRPIQIAARGGYLSIVHLLLQAGAHVSTLSEETEHSSIALAAKHGRLDVMMLFLHRCNEESERVRELRRTARECAVQKHQVVIVQYLDEYELSNAKSGHRLEGVVTP